MNRRFSRAKIIKIKLFSKTFSKQFNSFIISHRITLYRLYAVEQILFLHTLFVNIIAL